MAIDLNTAGKQRDNALIPDGTYCRVQIALDRGGSSLPGMDALDTGLFKAAKPPSDAMMIAMRLVVTHGPYTGKPIFENWIVEGGNLDEQGLSKGGKITKERVRGAVEAIQNLHPDDVSPAAQQKRILRAFSDLNGQFIPVRVDVQEGTNGYADSNRVSIVVTPEMEEYVPVMQGQQVPPKPSRKSSAASRPAPQTRAAGWADASQPSPPQQGDMLAPAPASPPPPAAPIGVDPSWQRSPDGQHAWNGSAWVSAAAPPPPPPPPPMPSGNSVAAPAAAPTAPAPGGTVMPAWASS